MTKKLLSLLVAVLMVLALVPMGALAKAEAEVESFNKITQRVRLNDGFRFAESRTKAGVTDSRDTEYVCDGSVYSFDFETSYSSEGWWTYDRDSTNYTYDNWLQNSGFGVDDSVAMISLSYYNGVGAMNQDNWLISPEITVPSDGTYYLSYWASSVDSSYLDKMQVLVAEAGSGAYNASSGTISYNSWTSLRSLESIPAEYTNYMIDLSSYAGKTVSFAFRHYCNDYYILCLDDVAVGRRVEMIYETGVTLDKSTLYRCYRCRTDKCYCCSRGCDLFQSYLDFKRSISCRCKRCWRHYRPCRGYRHHHSYYQTWPYRDVYGYCYRRGQ